MHLSIVDSFLLLFGFYIQYQKYTHRVFKAMSKTFFLKSRHKLLSLLPPAFSKTPQPMESITFYENQDNQTIGYSPLKRQTKVGWEQMMGASSVRFGNPRIQGTTVYLSPARSPDISVIRI